MFLTRSLKFSDANHSAAAAIAAHYEYDPYGGGVNDLSGYTYAEANPIRFSSKYHDAETGLGYWGYRYYSARLGRWINRDPLEEDGGLNLYAYVNDPLSGFDPLGLAPTINWIIYVKKSEGTAPTLDASFTVIVRDEACCFCDSIQWVQIVSDEWAGPLLEGGSKGWIVDNRSKAKPPYHTTPWYTKDVRAGEPVETVNGCVVDGVMRDSPGAHSRSWWWRSFRQDFESCAICIRRDSSCHKGTSCVLGCIRWGHMYTSKDGHSLQPTRGPLTPSDTMMQVLGGYEKRRPRSERGPIEASCES
jgi:RHS repeat-associated protein